MLTSVSSHAQAKAMPLQMAPDAGKHLPVAEHPASSGKPHSLPAPQSVLVVQMPPSPPAPELLLDPAPPLDDPDPPLPELALEPTLPLDDPELPIDREPPLDPGLPLDPELLPELSSAAASLKLNERPLPEQPMALSAAQTATSELTARASIDFMESPGL
jgi:hypothetical protein